MNKNLSLYKTFDLNISISLGIGEFYSVKIKKAGLKLNENEEKYLKDLADKLNPFKDDVKKESAEFTKLLLN